MTFSDRLSILAAIAVVPLAVLAGCAPVDPVDTSSPSPSASPSESPAPAPEPTFEAFPELDCRSVLTADRSAEWEGRAADGFGMSETFESDVADIPLLGRFAPLGGHVCRWGYPGTDASLIYGWSPLPAAERDGIVAAVRAEGATEAPHPRGLLLEDHHLDGMSADDRVTRYLFTDAGWYTDDTSSSLLDELVAAMEGPAA